MLLQKDIDRINRPAPKQKPGMFQSWGKFFSFVGYCLLAWTAVYIVYQGITLWWQVADKMVSAAVKG